MKLKRLDYFRAESRFLEMQETGFAPRDNLGPDATVVRDRLSVLGNIDSHSSAIGTDIVAGLALYRILAPGILTMRNAADDGVWRFLSLDVVPEIVHKRAGAKANWFYQGKWRPWLKRIWWWVHLSWQGSEPETLVILQKMTTDTIAQLVERGGMGFRVDLCRKIVSKFAHYDVSEDLFRRVMCYNTALLVGADPKFTHGGTDGYVDRLFQSAVEGKKER